MHFAKIDDPRFKLYDLTVADDSVGRCRDLDLFSLLVTHLLKGVCISTELFLGFKVWFYGWAYCLYKL